MIEHLHIKDVTLISQQDIDFSSKINILSGETGAGKSIIIDCIDFVMGGKVSVDFVRHGSQTAKVDALLHISQDSTYNYISEQGITLNEDRKILISRSLSISGKTTVRINGKPTSLSILKEISSQTIDIYGQFEHHFLLDEKQHINLLDKFCTSKIDEIKAKLSTTIEDYKNINNLIQKIENENNNLEHIQEMVYEIGSLELLPNEEEITSDKINNLNSFREIAEGINNSLNLLYQEDGAQNKISKAIKYLKNISHLTKDNNALESLENISIQLEDTTRILNQTHTDFDETQLNKLEERLAIIHSIKRKYKMTINEIIDYYNILKTQLEEIEKNAIELDNLKKQRKSVQSNIVIFCNNINALRNDAKKILENQIIENLSDLGMKNTKFEIKIEKKQTFSRNGNDVVSFQISPNIGEPLRPLAKIASGGEMSRIMLSIKIVISQGNTIETFVFDEIDTGVSGRTAQMVANKLKILSKNKQILCITHLPQIAAIADRHFLIEKLIYNNSTITNINILKDKEITEEIARLIGGLTITKNTLAAAKELKEMAK